MTDHKTDRQDTLALTTSIVTAHLSNNHVETSEIPHLIETVHKTLSGLANNSPDQTERPQPAVAIKKSIQDDYLICLEDGKKLKMLKRHLMTAYGMTPDDYRQRWGLSADYPMVAPNYAKKRSALAKNIGLGREKR